MIIQPIIGGTPLYFIANLSRSENYKYFGIYLITLILSSFAFTPMMRFFMFSIQDSFLSLASLPFIVFLVSLFTGFSIPYDRIPWEFRWMYNNKYL